MFIFLSCKLLFFFYFYTLFLVLINLIPGPQMVKAHRAVMFLEKWGEGAILWFILIYWHNQNTYWFSHIFRHIKSVSFNHSQVSNCNTHCKTVVSFTNSYDIITKSDIAISHWFWLKRHWLGTNPWIISSWQEENQRCACVDM